MAQKTRRMDNDSGSYLTLDLIQYLTLMCDAPTKFVLRLTSNVFYHCIPVSDIHKERYNLCRIAATYSSLSVLRVLHDFGWLSNEDSFTAAATTGNLEVLEWLWDNECNYLVDAAIAVGKSGNLDVLKWMHDKSCNGRYRDCYGPAFYGACKNGHVGIVEFIMSTSENKENPYSIISTSKYNLGFKLAAESGHKNILELAAKKGHEFLPSVCYAAAEGGHEELLKWLSTLMKIPLTSTMCKSVIEGGNKNIIDWLLEQEPHRHEEICYTAIKSGQLDLVVRLIGLGYPIGVMIIINAIESKDVSVVKWTLDNCASSYSLRHACYKAASVGSLEILKLLRERECPWSAGTTTIAAINGNLEVLTWAINNGYRCSSGILLNACRGGNIDMVEYLIGKGYTSNRYTDCVLFAINRGYTDVAKCLCDNFSNLIQMDTVAVSALEKNNIAMLIYIHNRSSNSIASCALKESTYHCVNVDTYRWLFAKGYYIDTAEIYKHCISLDNVRVFGWLLRAGYKPPKQVISSLKEENPGEQSPKRLLDCARKYGLL